MQSHLRLFIVSLIVICLLVVSAVLGAFRKTKPASLLAAGPNQLQVDKARIAQERPISSLVAPLDLQALTKNADLIVVGRVESVRSSDYLIENVEGRTMKAQRMVALLSVDKVIKGQPDGPTLSFDFLMPGTQLPYRDIRASQFGMFFLSKNKAQGYTVLNPYYPFVIASSAPIATDGENLDRVVTVIGRKFTEPASSVGDRRAIVDILSSARTTLADKFLRQALKDNDVVVRLQALSALLNEGDLSVLAMAERTLLHPTVDIEEYLLTNLSSALEGIKDPRAIPTLKRLLSSTNPNARLGATIALRHMRIPDVIDALVIALSDRDREVRYEAVMGLAEITGKDDWAPAISLYQRDEQRYLEYWKEWAKAR